MFRILFLLLVMLFGHTCTYAAPTSFQQLLDSLDAAGLEERDATIRHIDSLLQHMGSLSPEESLRLEILKARIYVRKNEPEKSMDLLKQINLPPSISKRTEQELEYTRASLYLFQNQLHLSKSTNLRAMELGFHDSTMHCLLYANLAYAEYLLGNQRLSLKLEKTSVDYLPKSAPATTWATSLSNLGTSYLEMGYLDSARMCYDASLSYSPRDEMKCVVLINLGLIEEKEGDYYEAVKYYRSLRDPARNANDMESLKISYRNEAYALLKAKDTSMAVWTLNSLISLQDSLNKGLTAEEFAALEAKFKNSLQEQELNQLKKTTKLTYIIGLLVVMVLVVTSVTIYLTFRGRLQRKALEVEQTKAEARNKSLLSLAQGQEQERQRLAKDLHDGIGILLSTLKLSISRLKPANDKQGGQLKELNEIIEEATKSIREVSYDLMPSSLTKLGLKQAVDDQLKRIKRNEQIECSLDVQGELKNMEIQQSVWLFRIIQELLNNSIKYANASALSLQLTATDDQLAMVYSDDGIGFDSSSVKSGNGLLNIKHRVQAMNGDLFFGNNNNHQGFYCQIHIPLS